MSTLRVDSIKRLGAASSDSDSITIAGNGNVTLKGGFVGNIIEKIGGLCDGSTRTTKSGTTVTLPNVTAVQTATATSWVDLTGSSIDYLPPSGTIGVQYDFIHRAGWDDTAHSIQHYRMYLDSTEIAYSRQTHAAQYMEGEVGCSWYFRIDSSLSSVDGNTGAVPNWTSAKTMKWQTRAYGSNDVGRIHGSQYWNGGGGNLFHMPQIYITAFGASV